MQQPMEAYLPYLFSLALQKSGNFADAEDLTQDVLLAAYTQLQSGRPIEHAPSWLSGTLNHKYYDMLRKKYQLPTISIDAVPEPPVCEDAPPDRPSDEQIRQEIAYLSKRYREVIVRHYLLGEKVDAIAKSLRIPKGTVLSRLATGRAQLRKGMEQMEVQAYEKLSHTPERLELSCHGRPGLKEEPYSLVANDLMKQNILILAYETPLTAVELARALGIPAPYVESAVDDLVGAELMRRIGNRVCTDFLITQPQDLLKNLEHEIAFTEQHYSSLWGILSQAIHAVNTLPWVKALEDCQRTILEYFYILHILSSGLYTATTRLIPSQETYPPRPDGGAWIAVGSRYPLDFDFASYTLGGQRGNVVFRGETSVGLCSPHCRARARPLRRPCPAPVSHSKNSPDPAGEGNGCRQGRRATAGCRPPSLRTPHAALSAPAGRVAPCPPRVRWENTATAGNGAPITKIFWAPARSSCTSTTRSPI